MIFESLKVYNVCFIPPRLAGIVISEPFTGILNFKIFIVPKACLVGED